MIYGALRHCVTCCCQPLGLDAVPQEVAEVQPMPPEKLTAAPVAVAKGAKVRMQDGRH